MDDETKMTRAEFCRAAGRWLGVAGLGALAVDLLSRPGAPETCDRRGWCRDCGRRQACGLPQAKSFRQVRREVDRG